MSLHIQECPFVLDVNLGVISRLETISVPNQGENTKGLELVCKVPESQQSHLSKESAFTPPFLLSVSGIRT